MFQITVWTFLRAGKLYITERRGPSTNVSYFHYRSGLVFTCTHTHMHTGLHRHTIVVCCCCCSRSRSRLGSRSRSRSHSRPRSHSRSCSCCFVDSTCHQLVMAASSLQELAESESESEIFIRSFQTQETSAKTITGRCRRGHLEK